MSDRKTILSADRVYRYVLWREWNTAEMYDGCNDGERGSDAQYSYAMFIGLNPSTADETNNDPTIRKCVGFAKRWGYGALCMTNLFAFRATNPKDMRKADNPAGEDNQHHLLQCASKAGIVIAAWGCNGNFRNQDLTVRQWLSQIGTVLHCLRATKAGHPEHPLYIPCKTAPKPFPID